MVTDIDLVKAKSSSPKATLDSPDQYSSQESIVPAVFPFNAA